MQNTLKRVSAMLLVFLMAFAYMPGIGEAGKAYADTALTGSGTTEDPYIITDEAGLREFAQLATADNYDGNAKLGADITLSSAWTAIKSQYISSAYAGVFDGDGHTIKGLSVSGSGQQGLFAYANGCTIKNLCVEGEVTSTNNAAGGIVGSLRYGTIENCSFKGSVTTSSSANNGDAGGIVGYAGYSESAAMKSTIIGCSNYASTEGKYAGGIAGRTKWCTFENSYNSGAVNGTTRSGGIVGQVASGTVSFINCYSIGDNKGASSSKADIVDFISGTATSLTNCYYKDLLKGNDAGTVTDCDVIDKDTLLSKLGNAFVEDANNINNGYPVLAWEAGAEVTPEDPEIRITNANPLYITSNESNPTEIVQVRYTAIDDSTPIEWSIKSGSDVISLVTITDDNANNSKITVRANKAGVAEIVAKTDDETYSAEARINVFPAITTFELENEIFAGETTSAIVNCLGGTKYDKDNYPELTGFTWKYWDSQSDYLNNQSGGTQITGNGMEVTVPEEAEGKWLTATLAYQGENKTPSNRGIIVKSRVEVTGVDIDGATEVDGALTAKTGANLEAKAKGQDGKEPTNLTYKWQKYRSDWEDIEGATSNKYMIPDSKDELNSKYRVIVTGENGSSATSQEVTINAISDKIADEDMLEEVASKYGLGVLRPEFGTDTNVCTFLENDIKKKGYDGVSVSVKSVEKRTYPMVGDAEIASDGTLTFFYYDPLSTSSNMPMNQFDVVFALTKGDASKDLKKIVQLRWDVDRLTAALKARVADKIDEALIKGDNTSLNEVETQLELPRYIIEDGSKKQLCEISWVSSDTNVIQIKDKDSSELLGDFVGKVTRYGEDKNVTLTATFDYKNAETNGEKAGVATLTKTFDVTVKAKPVPTEEELLDILNRYYTNDRLTDFATKEAIDLNAVDSDIQLPRYTTIKDENNQRVFENKEITVTSNSDAAAVNGYRVAVDPFKGGDVELTVTFTRDGVTASKVIPIHIVTLSDEVLDKEIEMMEIAKAHYFDGINDNQYDDKDSILGNLHAFQEMTLDSEKNPVWAYNVSDKTSKGIIPDSYWEEGQSEEMEGSGYNRFKSSDPNTIQHENLVVTRAEESKEVTLTSWLSSEQYGKYAKKYPENEKLQKLYKQEVSVTVTVIGTADQKEALAAKIAEAEALEEEISEGPQPGEYEEGTKDALQAVIDEAKAVYGNDEASDKDVVSALNKLTKAIEEAKKKVNPSTAKITVSVSNFEKANKFDFIPQEIEVSSDTAEKYGETRDAEAGNYGKVTFADVVFKVHELKYGDAFTADTVSDYIELSPSGYFGKCLGVSTYNISYLINEDLTMSGGAFVEVLEDGDEAALYKYQDEANFSDLYTHFTEKEITVRAGEEVVLQIEGLGWTHPLGPVSKHKDGTVKAATYDETGELTPLEGAEMDNDGKITLSFSEEGEYRVTASGQVNGAYTDYSDWQNPQLMSDVAVPIVLPYAKITVLPADEENTVQNAIQDAEDAVKKAEVAAKEAEDAKKAAEEAAKKAADSRKAAEEAAKTPGEEAVAAAEKAKKDADDAVKAAEEAAKKADEAKKAADEAVEKADKAMELAGTDAEKEAAKEVKNAADEKQWNADDAKDLADEALADAKQTQKDAADAVKEAKTAKEAAEKQKDDPKKDSNSGNGQSGGNNDDQKPSDDKKPTDDKKPAASDSDKDPDSKTPSAANLKKAKVNKKLNIKAGSISTAAKTGKKQMIVKWKKVKNATNYKIAYRKAGAKKWTEEWTNGKNKITLKKMKKNGLYEFKLMAVRKSGSTWTKSKWSKVNYRFYAKVKQKVKAGKKSAVVKVKKLKKASGYEVLYGKSKKVAKMKVKAFKGAKKTKLKIKGLKKGKKYFVQSRPYKKYKGHKYIGILNGAKKVKAK